MLFIKAIIEIDPSLITYRIGSNVMATIIDFHQFDEQYLGFVKAARLDLVIIPSVFGRFIKMGVGNRLKDTPANPFDQLYLLKIDPVC